MNWIIKRLLKSKTVWYMLADKLSALAEKKLDLDPNIVRQIVLLFGSLMTGKELLNQGKTAAVVKKIKKMQ